MADLPEPRIADVDRDRVSQLLRVAYGEGRITEGELEERLVTVYDAKTASQLNVVLADLPVPAVAAVQPLAVPPVAAAKQGLSLDFQAAGFLLLPAIVCTLIYLMTIPGGYFWPMWVWLGCGVPAGIVLFSSDDEEEGETPEITP